MYKNPQEPEDQRMMERQLSPDEMAALRAAGELHGDEVAFWMGDLLVAENILSRERRRLNDSMLRESPRRLLRD